MKRTPHLSTDRGRRVLIKLRSGVKFVAKFKDKKPHYMYFFDHEPVPTKDIVNFTIYKLQVY